MEEELEILTLSDMSSHSSHQDQTASNVTTTPEPESAQGVNSAVTEIRKNIYQLSVLDRSVSSMALAKAVKCTPLSITADDDSDDGDCLSPNNCYDTDMDRFYSNWTSALPEYTNVQEHSMFAASDSMSCNYVEELRHNFRMSKEKKVFQPSFVNESQDLFPISDYGGPLCKVDNNDTWGDNYNIDTSTSSNTPEAVSQDNMSELGTRISNSSAHSQRKSEKTTVLQSLRMSIEGAMQDGNSNFVRGLSLHPLQTNTSVLMLNRRSGYTNKFSADDYLSTIPLVGFPPDHDWNDKFTAGLN